MISTKIVGTYYLSEEVKEYVKELEKETILGLKHEPDNKVDPNAIQVISLDEEHNGTHLGYISKDINVGILEKLTKGIKLQVIFKGGQNIQIKEEGEQEVNYFQVF